MCRRVQCWCIASFTSPSSSSRPPHLHPPVPSLRRPLFPEAMDLYAPLAYAKSLDPSTISAAPPVPPLALPHDQPYLGPPKRPGSDIPNSSVPNQEEPAQTSEKHSGAQELPKSESVWDKLYDFDVKLIDVVSSGPDALYRFSITVCSNQQFRTLKPAADYCAD